jgi:hypothetical protein
MEVWHEMFFGQCAVMFLSLLPGQLKRTGKISSDCREGPGYERRCHTALLPPAQKMLREI